MIALNRLLVSVLLALGIVSVSDAETKSIYDTTCSACHGFGVAGAPVPGKVSDWEQRLKKPLDTLYQNAIEGFTGEFGNMPAKGGFYELSDEQVRDLVDYMIAQSGE